VRDFSGSRLAAAVGRLRLIMAKVAAVANAKRTLRDSIFFDAIESAKSLCLAVFVKDFTYSDDCSDLDRRLLALAQLLGTVTTGSRFARHPVN
jgi:hypothetical protein